MFVLYLQPIPKETPFNYTPLITIFCLFFYLGRNKNLKLWAIQHILLIKGFVCKRFVHKVVST